MIGRQIVSSYTDSIAPTVEVIVRSLLLALLWPGVLWFVAWRLGSAWDRPEFAKEVGYALHMTALVYLSSELFRRFWPAMVWPKRISAGQSLALPCCGRTFAGYWWWACR